MNKNKSALLTAAIAGVLAAGTTLVTTSARADVNCYGINSCKGTGACGSKTTGASCAGSNACKGQGFISAKDEADCKSKGGSLTEGVAPAKEAKPAKSNKVKSKKAKPSEPATEAKPATTP